MGQSLLPQQIGWTPNGVGNGPNGTNLQSQVFIGKDVSVSWEAIGIAAGNAGRPAPLENLIINFTQISTSKKIGSIQMNVNDLLTLMATNSNIPTDGSLSMKFTEFDVCQNGQPMKCLLLASQIYAPTASDPAG